LRQSGTLYEKRPCSCIPAISGSKQDALTANFIKGPVAVQHFLSTRDWSREALQQILDRALGMKGGARSEILRDKAVALLFFNKSTRTRTSFEVGVRQLGGHPVTLDMASATWPMEMRDGVVMDGEPEEHVREAAPVLARYVDMLGIRAFPKFQDWQVEREDPLLHAFANHAGKPIINMETIVHPCQELAHMMTLQETRGDMAGKTFVLHWVWHPKPLNTAVANSALLIASKFGMNIRVVRPGDDYDLDERYMQAARDQGVAVETTSDRRAGMDGADVVYAKSWGALPYYGRWADEADQRAALRHWMIDTPDMAATNDGVISHCLPMRRNVKLSDAVADSPAFLGIEEAENRLHVQKALMERLMELNS
jgi:N-acetylornithine carbamoyltransferase